MNLTDSPKLTLALAAAGLILLIQGLVAALSSKIGFLSAGLGIYLILLAVLELKIAREQQKAHKDAAEISRLVAKGTPDAAFRRGFRTPVITVTVLYIMVWLLTMIAEPEKSGNTTTIITTTLGLILLAYATQKYLKK
jgi:hypothetical protein